jgi:hypothetical protein
VSKPPELEFDYEIAVVNGERGRRLAATPGRGESDAHGPGPRRARVGSAFDEAALTHPGELMVQSALLPLDHLAQFELA